MYVCLCHGLTDKKIKEIIEEKGCRQIKTLQKDCSAGKDCGSCVLQLKKILKEYDHICAPLTPEEEEAQKKKQA